MMLMTGDMMTYLVSAPVEVPHDVNDRRHDAPVGVPHDVDDGETQ